METDKNKPPTDTRWLFATFGEEEVASWVQQHGFRLLSKRSFNFWCLVLGIVHFQTPDWAIEVKEMEPW
jgi:hypothetical protein